MTNKKPDEKTLKKIDELIIREIRKLSDEMDELNVPDYIFYTSLTRLACTFWSCCLIRNGHNVGSILNIASQMTGKCVSDSLVLKHDYERENKNKH